MKYDASMTHLLVCVLCFLECVASVTAVRYGDYSVGHMPQYNDQHEEGDAAPGHEDYGDRSPDAPAHLDYKYEEEPQGRSDDLPIKDIVDDRRYSVLRSGHNRDLDKYSLDDTEPEEKSAKRFALRGSRFVKRNYAKRSDSQKHLKHVAIGKSDDNDNVENNSDYVHKHDIEAEGDGMIDVGRFRYRSTTQKKPRRKPRDRAHDPQEWRDIGNNVKLEHDEVDSRLEGENFENKNPRRFGGIIKESMNRNNKNSYEYDEYYDMKRVQHMKSRLPALLKQTTEATTINEPGSVAERELRALLARRQRKEAGDEPPGPPGPPGPAAPPPGSPPAPTFPPLAVDPQFDTQWNRFITSGRPSFPFHGQIWICSVLILINYLRRF